MSAANKLCVTIVGAMTLLLAVNGPAYGLVLADLKYMDFEGLFEKEKVQDFYNGGTGSFASGPGANLGVNFSSNVKATIDTELGTTGNIGGDLGMDIAITFFVEPSMMGNVSDGFKTGMNFSYSTSSLTKLVIYSEEDGMGEELASKFLPLASFGTGDFSGFGKVVHTGIDFAGIAKSFEFVSMEGKPNTLILDHLELGFGNPEPVTGLLALMGVTALGTAVGRRRSA